MKKETRNKIIATLLSVIVVGVILGVAYNAIMGRDGLITKTSSVEIEYDKGLVLESLTELIKEKYMAAYNESKTIADKKIEDLYNTDVGISYLVEKNVIEYYWFSKYDDKCDIYDYIKDNEKTDGQKRDDCFWINVNNIEQVKTIGKGSKYDGNVNQNMNDVFLLEKVSENEVIRYEVNYYNLKFQKEFVGVLEIANPLIK
ncbi:MAG: hypothetical protein J6J60_10560 [Clostridia bacterium]|nr:hypothetical protein [Clostridia bacterium]MBP3597813.1 hypothetical protein [Clostridia bacterium]